MDRDAAAAPQRAVDCAPTAHEVEKFTQAMAEYKRSSGRLFPTWSEVLEVLNSLGYVKPTDSIMNCVA